jgi:segregation and condensation protein B
VNPESPEEGIPSRDISDLETLKGIVEAVLFAATEPVPLRRLRGIVGRPASENMKKAVTALQEECRSAQRGVEIEEVAGGYRMVTNPDFSPWVMKIRATRREDRISQAALETLAIVAYKQPIPRAEVDAIRGVNSGDLLRRLLEKNLVKIVGKAETLGRPLLYGTTKKFLEVFGLKDLKDLPKGDWQGQPVPTTGDAPGPP